MKTRSFAILLLAPVGLCAAAFTAQEAEKELFAARYDRAADIYSQLLRDDPAWAPGYYGLVRALIGAHRAQEAYAAAARGLEHAPESAEVQTAAGLAAYRRGDLKEAEEHFLKARDHHPSYPYALKGLASIYNSVSKFKTGEALATQAYGATTGDPALIQAWANTLHGADHIAALKRALAIYDPASHEARSLRAHVAADEAAGGRKLRRLASPYQGYYIELVAIGANPRRKAYGVGLRIRLNGRRPLQLLLDTGASGISISSRVAEKAGLEILGGESAEVHGIGDQKPRDSLIYLAASVDIGDVRFTDFPVEAFRAARTDDYDGLIGADVFKKFQVSIDFHKSELVLSPFADGPPGDDPSDAPDTPPTGYSRVFRFGHMLAVPTSINQGPPQLFLIDSGAWGNLIDTETALESTKVHRDYDARLAGVQGRVDEVSRANKVSLVFAGFRQDNSDLMAASLESVGDEAGVGIRGILGMPVLWQLKLTIDYRQGTVRFEKTGLRQ